MRGYLGGVGRKLPFKPEQGEDTADADILLEDLTDRDACVEELLASIITDGRDKGGGLTD